MSEVPKHILRAYKRVAARNGLVDALMGAKPDPKGKPTYRRAHRDAQTGIADAHAGLPMSNRARKRQVVRAEAYDIVTHQRLLVAGGEGIAALLGATRAMSSRHEKLAESDNVAIGARGERRGLGPPGRRGQQFKPPQRGVRATPGPAHGAVGHTIKIDSGTIGVHGDSGGPRTLWFEGTGNHRMIEENVPFANPPHDRSPEWVLEYWGGYHDALRLKQPYDGRQKSLEDPDCYAMILGQVTGIDADGEPTGNSHCPEDAHPAIKTFWAECALGVRRYIEAGRIAKESGARRAGGLYAKQHGLRDLIKWNEDTMRFEYTEEALRSFDDNGMDAP